MTDVPPPDSSGEAWVVKVDNQIASASRPVIWFTDAATGVFTAYDWAGHVTGTMSVTPGPPIFGQAFGVGLTQSPDGTMVVLRHGIPVDGGTVVARTVSDAQWARDSSHLCAVLTPTGQRYPASTTGALFVQDAHGSQISRIASFGTWGDNNDPAVLSCSVRDDRAIVGESAFNKTLDVSAIDLRTRTCVGSSGFAAQPSSEPIRRPLVASADGRFVALASPASPPSTVVRSVDLGVTVATIPGAVWGFTDDDSRVLTVGDGAGGTRSYYSLVNWRTGQVVWTAALNATVVLTRPGTGDVLLEEWNYRPVPGANRNQPYFVPVVVHADGTTVRFPTEVGPA